MFLKVKVFIFCIIYRISRLASCQEGEDSVLYRFFPKLKNGFFVDLGAHHPVRFSNTYSLYNMGWEGINIEPNKDKYEIFCKYRKRDVNINSAISSKSKIAYYMYSESALNTTCRKTVSLRKKQGIEFKKKIYLEGNTLKKILNKFCKGRTINFFNIDIEGNELEALKTNDWKKFRPQVIMVEILNETIPGVSKNKISKFLLRNNYVIFSKIFHNVIYLEKNFINEELGLNIS